VHTYWFSYKLKVYSQLSDVQILYNSWNYLRLPVKWPVKCYSNCQSYKTSDLPIPHPYKILVANVPTWSCFIRDKKALYYHKNLHFVWSSLNFYNIQMAFFFVFIQVPHVIFRTHMYNIILAGIIINWQQNFSCTHDLFTVNSKLYRPQLPLTIT